MGKSKLHLLCLVSHVPFPQLKRLVIYKKSLVESPLRSPIIPCLLKCDQCFVEYLLCAALTYSAKNVFKFMPKAHYSWAPYLFSFDPWVLNRNPWTPRGQFLLYMPMYVFPPERRSMVLNRILSHWVLEKVKNNCFK